VKEGALFGFALGTSCAWLTCTRFVMGSALYAAQAFLLLPSTCWLESERTEEGEGCVLNGGSEDPARVAERLDDDEVL